MIDAHLATFYMKQKVAREIDKLLHEFKEQEKFGRYTLTYAAVYDCLEELKIRCLND